MTAGPSDGLAMLGIQGWALAAYRVR